jgi:carbamate kinase
MDSILIKETKKQETEKQIATSSMMPKIGPTIRSFLDSGNNAIIISIDNTFPSPSRMGEAINTR